MTKLAKLQLVGPLVLALTIVAEELATYWLAWKPSSELAWYLNLKLFGAFQRSHYILSDHFSTPYFQLLFVAAPILVLAYGGIAFRLRLPIAVASNLSFAYAFFLAFASNRIDSPAQQAASLAGTAHDFVFNFSALNPTIGPQAYVLTALLIPTLLSFMAAHLLYLRAVRKG
jgi:hypothetical protein